jgi:hypothetical protein
MDKRSLDDKQRSKEVTEVMSRNIRAGHERDYDDWLRRFILSERQFPGYLGTTIIALEAMSPLCGTLSIASSIRRRWMHGKIQKNHSNY